MSVLSWLVDLVKGIIGTIMNFLQKHGIALLIVALIVAVFVPGAFAAVGAYISSAWVSVTGWVASGWASLATWAGGALTGVADWASSIGWGTFLKLATGAAILLDPKGAASALGSLAKTAASVASSVVRPFMPWILGGLGLYLLTKSKSNGGTTVVTSQPALQRQAALKGGTSG